MMRFSTGRARISPRAVARLAQVRSIAAPAALLMATGLMAAGLGATSALAGPADVEAVEVVAEGGSAYSFSVTVRHADEGWEHYADRWEVLGENEDVLATRVLLHPHVDEQPFTRSQNAVQIPAGLTRVTVRAHDKVHGYGGKEMLVDLPGR